MKHVLLLAVVLFALSGFARSDPPALKPGKLFDNLAEAALLAMTQRAEELKIKGVAVVACVEGENVTAWSSIMMVVGSMKNAPTKKNRGANLLAIAFASAGQARETQATHRGQRPSKMLSGSRPPQFGHYCASLIIQRSIVALLGTNEYPAHCDKENATAGIPGSVLDSKTLF